MTGHILMLGIEAVCLGAGSFAIVSIARTVSGALPSVRRLRDDVASLGDTRDFSIVIRQTRVSELPRLRRVDVRRRAPVLVPALGDARHAA